MLITDCYNDFSDYGNFTPLRWLLQYKMIETENKFLLAGDKFMPQMHLRQPTALSKTLFTYSACGLFTKNKERIQKFKETGDLRYICQKELDKTFFKHDIAYRYFKDFPRRTDSDKVLRDQTFNIAKNSKYDEYQRGLGSVVYNFFDKKSAGGAVIGTRSKNLATRNKYAIKNKDILKSKNLAVGKNVCICSEKCGFYFSIFKLSWDTKQSKRSQNVKFCHRQSGYLVYC